VKTDVHPEVLSEHERQISWYESSTPVMRYAVVIERAASNFSAYVPDLPGCVATGATVGEIERSIRKAIELHIEGLREDGLPVPQPSSQVEYVDVAA
jgi:predicted RNase H-like HicB family nuclease